MSSVPKKDLNKIYRAHFNLGRENYVTVHANLKNWINFKEDYFAKEKLDVKKKTKKQKALGCRNIKTQIQENSTTSYKRHAHYFKQFSLYLSGQKNNNEKIKAGGEKEFCSSCLNLMH